MDLKVFDLGLVNFESAWQFQKDTFEKVKSGILDSCLILCQHYPVITLGRQAQRKNILADEKELAVKQTSLFNTERGGDVTYHGPGQLIAYPIFNLNYYKKDIHLFLRSLEQVVIEFLSGFAIKAGRISGLTGVWVENKKIASIGIAIKNWITFHGLSINIKEGDLENFSLIRPCGMNIGMTSMETLLRREVKIPDIKPKLITILREVFAPQPEIIAV